MELFSPIIGFDMYRISQERKFLEILFLVRFLVIFRNVFALFDITYTKSYNLDMDLRSPVHLLLISTLC